MPAPRARRALCGRLCALAAHFSLCVSTLESRIITQLLMAQSIGTNDTSRQGRSWERQLDSVEEGAPSDLWLHCWQACTRGEDSEGARIVERLLRHGQVKQVCVLHNRFGALLQVCTTCYDCLLEAARKNSTSITNFSIRQHPATVS
jgi:hypothetical protein